MDFICYVDKIRFLCALPPKLRAAWAETVGRLLKPGTGQLVTLIFPIGDYEGGPPFAVSTQLYLLSLSLSFLAF